MIREDTNQLYNVVSVDSIGYVDVEDKFQKVTQELKKKDRELVQMRGLIKVLNKTIIDLKERLQGITK